MNIKEIKEMIELMNKNNLSELEIEKEGVRIKLKKSGGIVTQQILDERLATPQTLREEKVPHKIVESKPKKALLEIKAPMVGTFYRSPSPEAPPFVDIGTKVNVGQVVCIIEAMKLMNEIKSEIEGKVVDILVENGSPVEFGQILFLIEPV